MSNKGGRVSPDYLADIAPEYASMKKGSTEKTGGEFNLPLGRVLTDSCPSCLNVHKTDKHFGKFEQVPQFTAVLQGGFLHERTGTRNFVTY